MYSKNINIQFVPENEQNFELIDKIKTFGEIFYRENLNLNSNLEIIIIFQIMA